MMSWPGIWMHLPPGVELHAVVHAADIVAFDPPHRERRRAMATAVVERDDLAAGAAIEHDRLLQDGAGQLLAVDQFVIPGRDVPGIVAERFRRRVMTPLLVAKIAILPCCRSSSRSSGGCRENPNSLDTLYRHDGQSRGWNGGTGSCFARSSSMAALAPPPACSAIPNRVSVLQCNGWKAISACG